MQVLALRPKGADVDPDYKDSIVVDYIARDMELVEAFNASGMAVEGFTQSLKQLMEKSRNFQPFGNPREPERKPAVIEVMY